MTEIKEIAPRLPTKYLRNFFAEKDLPTVTWELTDNDGTLHIISNAVVVEHMVTCPVSEAKDLANVLRRIDFANGDVDHFLKHLAGALANNHTLDVGVAGLERTIELLDASGVGHAGAGPNRDEAYAPAVHQIGEISIAVVSFSRVLFDPSHQTNRQFPLLV